MYLPHYVSGFIYTHLFVIPKGVGKRKGVINMPWKIPYGLQAAGNYLLLINAIPQTQGKEIKTEQA